MSTNDSVVDSIETLNNIIENENIPMEETIFSKMVSSWSNLYQRNQEIITSSVSNKEATTKKKEFNARLGYNNDVMVNSLKIALLGNSEEQLEFKQNSNKMNAKMKKINNKIV